MNRPEALIGGARDKFDAQGQLTDETPRKFLRTFLENLLVWIRQITPHRAEA